MNLPLRLLALLALATGLLRAEDLTPAQQAAVDHKVAEIKAWAASPEVTGAVATQNQHPPADHAGMTQDKWKSLSVLDPFVRGLAKNPAGAFLKSKKTDWVAEAFLSDARGEKVAFLAKPSNWSHAGKAKHDQPMAGQVWQGPVELDESTGLRQVQVAVPVLHDGRPAGSLVVGVSLSKLE